jgi:hypothetical protein
MRRIRKTGCMRRPGQRLTRCICLYGFWSEELLKKIGELTVERDFLSRGLLRSR